MAIITLTNGEKTLIDDEDYQKVSHFKWHKGSRGYVSYSLYLGGGRKAPKIRHLRLHREVMGAVPGSIVDHINGDKLDNRKVNLRLCTSGQNSCNRGVQKNNVIGIKGVRLNEYGRWSARIMKNRISYFLGYFSTAEEAARAYNEAAPKFHGEFAKLNTA